MEGRIKERAQSYKEEISEHLREFIEIPTSNPPGESYKECIEYLTGILKKWDVDHEVIEVPQERYSRYSIVGSHGSGNTALHFHGHYDVVPPDSNEQFTAEVRGDRIYGRGSSDMKSGVLAMLYAIRALKELNTPLKNRITFSIVPDEETGGRLGTEHLFKKGILPPEGDIKGMLMPEPTSGVVWSATKGALTYEINIKGKYSHVALAHEGENAFEHLIDMAKSLLRLKEKIEKRVTDIPVNPPGANRSVLLIGGRAGSGVNFNVVPETAFFTMDRRFNPEEKLDEVRTEIDKILGEYRKKGVDFTVEELQSGESSIAGTDTPLAETLRDVANDIKGCEPTFELCPGLCEIRFFNSAGIPAYAYGPGLLEVSHGPDEYVSLNEIIDFTEIYAVTAYRMLH